MIIIRRHCRHLGQSLLKLGSAPTLGACFQIIGRGQNRYFFRIANVMNWLLDTFSWVARSRICLCKESGKRRLMDSW